MSIKQEMDSQGLIRIRDFWNLPQVTAKRRSWRKIESREDGYIKEKIEELMNILEQRKMLVADGKDQLRRGKNKEGIFNIQEAKIIILNIEPCGLANPWKKLWSHQGWTKTKLFVWLVHHKKILTWENIQKSVVHGAI